MAKVKHCEFCGKEVTTGFFRGTACYLDVGADESICCCEECYDKYEKTAERVQDRLSAKVYNFEKSTHRKLNSAGLAAFFLQYLAEEKRTIERCGFVDRLSDELFFTYDDRGHFSVREFPLGGDIDANDMLDSIKAAQNTCPVWFSRDDISRLEYRVVRLGEVIDASTNAYSFEVRFNDEKTATFRPCITRMCFLGTSAFFGEKKNAKEKCVATLQRLQAIIGSNLPIVEVKKFY